MRRVCMTSQRLTCLARLASLVENLSEDVLPPAGLLVVFFTLIASRAHASSPIPQPQLRMGSSPALSTCQSLQCFPIPNTATPASSPIPLGAGLHTCGTFVAVLGPISIKRDWLFWPRFLKFIENFFDTFNPPAKNCKLALLKQRHNNSRQISWWIFALSSTHQPSNFTSSTRICVKK